MLHSVSPEDEAAEPRRVQPIRRLGWEFFCKACALEFEADWEMGRLIVCPRCATAFETGWQFNEKGQLVGPWLTRRAESKRED